MKQQTNNDCVITSLAYITDFTYEYLKEEIGYEASFEQVINFLECHDIDYEDHITQEGSSHFYEDYSSEDINGLFNNKELSIELDGKFGLFAVENVFSYHCIAFIDDKIFEPSSGKIKEFSQYQVLRFLVIND